MNSARPDEIDGTSSRSGICSPALTNSAVLAHCLPDLRRHARALMRRSTDAEDLAQDCMLLALAHVDNIADMRAYLFRTLRNAYADRIGRISRDIAALALDEAKLELVDRNSPHLRLEIRDVARQVARLPQKQQEVILLIAGGATYDEAALHLHVPVGTVMSRLSRARKALRGDFSANVGG